MDCSPPASYAHGILQARKLEWVTMPSCSGSSQTRDRTCVSYVSCTSRQVLQHHRESPQCVTINVFILFSLFSAHQKESGLFYRIKVWEASVSTVIIGLRFGKQEERAGLWGQATLAV